MFAFSGIGVTCGLDKTNILYGRKPLRLGGGVTSACSVSLRLFCLQRQQPPSLTEDRLEIVDLYLSDGHPFEKTRIFGYTGSQD